MVQIFCIYLQTVGLLIHLTKRKQLLIFHTFTKLWLWSKMKILLILTIWLFIILVCGNLRELLLMLSELQNLQYNQNLNVASVYYKDVCYFQKSMRQKN